MTKSTITIIADRTNSHAHIFVEPPDHEWVKKHYPGIVYRGNTKELDLWMSVVFLLPEHKALLGHPEPIEPTDRYRDIAWNAYTKKWEPILPESETYPGQQIITQWKHKGQWVTVPEDSDND